MEVTVIGGGYVGLVTAACLAGIGHDVCCVEVAPERFRSLRNGIAPIYEPGLDELLRSTVGRTLHFADRIEVGVSHAETVFLCVGTPQREDGRADLTQVEGAARQIAGCLREYRVIVEKSTVPVNTHRWIRRTVLREVGDRVAFDVASNPEFLREGTAIEDFMKPDRIVLGVESQRAREALTAVYAPLEASGARILFTDTASAELIKHASNSFLATKISYINMIAELCERVGADVETVSLGMGLDRRIGGAGLDAGIGYGGSCFPKDVRAFVRMAEDSGLSFGLLKETERINASRRVSFLSRVREVLWISRDKTVAVWGLAYKPGTDDVRESPSLDIVRGLLSDGAIVRAYDPHAGDAFQTAIGEWQGLSVCADALSAVQGADALLVLTEWPEFAAVDWIAVRSAMRYPIVLDGRNMLEPKEMSDKGFEYYSVGRGER